MCPCFRLDRCCGLGSNSRPQPAHIICMIPSSSKRDASATGSSSRVSDRPGRLPTGTEAHSSPVGLSARLRSLPCKGSSPDRCSRGRRVCMASCSPPLSQYIGHCSCAGSISGSNIMVAPRKYAGQQHQATIFIAWYLSGPSAIGTIHMLGTSGFALPH
jgi:hypothetical protein